MTPSGDERNGVWSRKTDSGAGSGEKKRWEVLTELVGEAWDMAADERASYLAKACKGDQALLAEAESLLAERESMAEFLETGLFNEGQLSPGTMLGSYVIESQIGQGGMGVVYCGRDMRLGRSVAVKVVRFRGLPGGRRREQFLNEARTTAALNHPNIVTIYDVGSTAELDFIVMEYVSGEPLDRLLARTEGLRLAQALCFGEDIAEALAHAHSKQIIHRDLKPGNIIVTEEGSVKVFDFGLAKQIGKSNVIHHPEVSALARTAQSSNSSLSGQIAGTVSYMSPEQTQGARVDARSDLFSFGCVLFEMITGKRAFAGVNAADTLAKIQRAQYPSIQGFVPHLPHEIEKLIASCLQLNAESRPQSAKDVAAILRTVRARLEGRARRVKQLVVLLLAVLSFGVWFSFRRLESRLASPEAPLQAFPLTGGAASEFTPSISLDGSKVAFAVEGSQPRVRHLSVKSINGGEPMAITSGAADDTDPVWSPSGQRIAFRRVFGGGNPEVWTVSAQGGSEQKVTDLSAVIDLVTQPTICWPEENLLVISHQVTPGGPSALYRVDLATGAKIQLTEPPQSVEGDFSPQVSKDGRFLGFVRISTWNSSSIYILPLTEARLPAGRPQQIRTGELRPNAVAWANKDKELIFGAGFADHSLWRVALRPGAVPQRLNIVGADGGMNPSLSTDQAIVFARQREDADIWRLDLTSGQNTNLSPRLLISSFAMDLRPQYSPDGKMISFISLRSGFAEVWVSDANGARATAITARLDPSTGDPYWSPDGEFLVFIAAPEGLYQIFKQPARGGAAVQLTHDPAMHVQPSWSRDGRWIYFASNSHGSFRIHKIPSTGGEPVPVTQHDGFASLESLDGSFLYFTDSDNSVARLWRRNLENGSEVPLNLSVWRRNFAPVENGLYVEATLGPQQTPGIWFANQKGTKTRLVLRMEGMAPPGFLSVSPDSRYLLFTKYKVDSHVMIVRGFR